jgi:hypothetical protein
MSERDVTPNWVGAVSQYSEERYKRKTGYKIRFTISKGFYTTTIFTRKERVRHLKWIDLDYVSTAGFPFRVRLHEPKLQGYWDLSKTWDEGHGRMSIRLSCSRIDRLLINGISTRPEMWPADTDDER